MTTQDQIDNLIYELYGKNIPLAKKEERCLGKNGFVVDNNVIFLSCNNCKLFTNFCEDHLYLENEMDILSIFDEWTLDNQNVIKQIKFCTSCKSLSKFNNIDNISNITDSCSKCFNKISPYDNIDKLSNDIKIKEKKLIEDTVKEYKKINIKMLIKKCNIGTCSNDSHIVTKFKYCLDHITCSMRDFFSNNKIDVPETINSLKKYSIYKKEVPYYVILRLYDGICSFDVLLDTNILFLSGIIPMTFYHRGSIMEETVPLLPYLIKINKHGFFSTYSQMSLRLPEKEQNSYITGIIENNTKSNQLIKFLKSRYDIFFTISNFKTKSYISNFPKNIQNYSVTRIKRPSSSDVEMPSGDEDCDDYLDKYNYLKELTEIWNNINEWDDYITILNKYDDFILTTAHYHPNILNMFNECIGIKIVCKEYDCECRTVEDILLEFYNNYSSTTENVTNN